MELNFKLTYNIPEELIKALGINEDTLFCTSYEDGTLCVEAVNEEDAELIKDADTLILHREKVCDHCTDVREKPKEASLLDVINSLSASEQKAVLRYLANRISSGEDF